MGFRSSLLLSMVIHLLLVAGACELFEFTGQPSRDIKSLTVSLGSVEVSQQIAKRKLRSEKPQRKKEGEARLVRSMKRNVSKSDKYLQAREVKSSPKIQPKAQEMAKEPEPEDSGTSRAENEVFREDIPRASYEEVYERENLKRIRKAIANYVKYPFMAKRMGWEGTVIVRFTLLPGGDLEELRVEKSSGYRILDDSALEAVRFALKEFPDPVERVTILVPVVFRMER